jgi:hypothetical protein
MATPFVVLFRALSERIGRQMIMLTGMTVAAMTST